MRKLNVSLSFLFLTFVTHVGIVAQEKPHDDFAREKIYTPAQIEMIKAQRKLIKADKEAFRNTLTDEQLAVFKDESLTREERRKVMKAMLTADQKALLTTNRQKAKSLREAFKATITDEQKEALKKRRHNLRQRRHKNRKKGHHLHHEKRRTKTGDNKTTPI